MNPVFINTYIEQYKNIVRESPSKGGDPAAGSPTATLLRLHPNHHPYLRHLPLLRVSTVTSGTNGLHDVTGGVYKAWERIHGAVADAPLLAIPTSCRRVADDNLNSARVLGVCSILRSFFPLCLAL